jgi:hypothetical protein
MIAVQKLEGWMKEVRLVAAAGLLALACNYVMAGPITWTPIGGGSSAADDDDFQPKTYTPIGDILFGSDGSKGYRSGDTSVGDDGTSSRQSGNVVTQSDGTLTQVIGNTLYGQKPDGTQFYCRMQGGQAACYPR